MRSLAASPWATVVDTVAYLSDPVGVETGEFGSQQGIFVSSFASHNVYFFSLEALGNYRVQRPPQPVALFGGGLDVNADGDLSEASIRDPSRMVYDSTSNLLYIASANSMTIRVVNLRNSIAGTISSSSNAPIVFGSPSTSHFPGLDIQKATPSLMFVTSPRLLYKLVRKTSSFNSNSVSSYESITSYFSGERESEWMLTSAAPDTLRNILYVSVSGNINQILRVPVDAMDSSSSSRISTLAGGRASYWQGLGSTVPYVYSDDAANSRVFMPVHVQFDNADQIILWSEAYPMMDDILAGSLTIRQMSISSADPYVKFFAGADAAIMSPVSTDPSTYAGVWGGYTDGRDSGAEFKYPISIKYSSSTRDDTSDSYPLVYVADRWNNVVRRVSRHVFTAAPSVSPSPTRSPTISQRPSVHPTPFPTAAPVTHKPTRNPTLSHAPTTPDMAGPSMAPTHVPTHAHAFGGNSHAPTAPPSAFIVYEDKSFFGRLGARGVNIGPSDLLLGALIGCILAGAVVYILSIMNPGRENGRGRRRSRGGRSRGGSSDGSAHGTGGRGGSGSDSGDGGSLTGAEYGGVTALFNKLSGFVTGRGDKMDVSGNGRHFDRLSTYSPSEGGDDLSVASDDVGESGRGRDAGVNSNLSRFIRGGSNHGADRSMHQSNLNRPNARNEDAEYGMSGHGGGKQSVEEMLSKLKRTKFQDTMNTSYISDQQGAEELMGQGEFDQPQQEPEQQQESRGGYLFGLF